MNSQEFDQIYRDLDEELRNTDVDHCKACGKYIHWWQGRTNAFTGFYHYKCFYKKQEQKA